MTKSDKSSKTERRPDADVGATTMGAEVSVVESSEDISPLNEPPHIKALRDAVYKGLVKKEQLEELPAYADTEPRVMVSISLYAAIEILEAVTAPK